MNSSLNERLQGELRDAGKILEAARLESRTNYDLEMLQETGFCSGVENYARHLSQSDRRAVRPGPCWTTSRKTICCS